jgi:medium-chain acyl-[acyl-carrier-protein] hydrolase
MELLGQSILVPNRRRGASRRLFCFPHAGVGPSVFRGWADDLAADAEVCLIQPPGKEGRHREPPCSSIEALLPILIEDMLPLLDRPFAFYGHSLGAKVAFECALGLRRIHHPEPAHIFVAASPAPQLPWRHSPLRQMPEEDFLSEVEKRYGALPREVISDPEMRALVVPSLRADFAIIETYKYLPDPPLHCDLTAFGGLQDPMVKQSELEAWREQATGRFRLQMLD